MPHDAQPAQRASPRRLGPETSTNQTRQSSQDLQNQYAKQLQDFVLGVNKRCCQREKVCHRPLAANSRHCSCRPEASMNTLLPTEKTNISSGALKGASNVARGGIFFMGSQVMLLKLPVEEIKRSVTDTTVSTWTLGPLHHVEQPHQGSEVVEKLALLSQTPDAISPDTRNTGDLFLCHARCVPRVRRNSLHAMDNDDTTGAATNAQ